MPSATEDQGEEVNGFLNVRYKGGKKFRWKRKYAVLRQDAIYLSDEKKGRRSRRSMEKEMSLPDDTSELRLPGIFSTCGTYHDKKTRKKFGFVLEPVDADSNEQWYFTCDDLYQQQKWLQAINDIISGRKVQKAVSCPEFDEIIVQTTTLQHLAKDRPKFHGRRLPAKRPTARSENALNGIPENADTKSETPDSSLANSPARDLPANGASTSAPASPAGKTMKDSPAVKRRDKKRGTFLRGIGARVSRIFGTQPPRSPTSPARLDHETAPSRVPVITTADGTDDKSVPTTTKVDEEESIPDVVSKDDIIKMLDFVSETTEQAVYKTVAIRGRISSVDEIKSRKELRDAYRSLRKAENALKGTMDDLSNVEDTLQSAPEVIPEKESPPEKDEQTEPVLVAAAPIAIDELAEEDRTTSDPNVSKGEDSKKEDNGETCERFNENLDKVEEFEERKASVSLMEAIQKTLNGKHAISITDKVEEEQEVEQDESTTHAQNETDTSKDEVDAEVKEENDENESTDEVAKETVESEEVEAQEETKVEEPENVVEESEEQNDKSDKAVPEAVPNPDEKTDTPQEEEPPKTSDSQ